MAQLDSDAFTYSNGALAAVSGGKWTALSGLNEYPANVVSNTAVGFPAQYTPAVITAWSGSATDHWSEIVIVDADGGNVGPAVRMNTVDTYYFLNCINTSVPTFEKKVAGSGTVLGVGTLTTAAGNGETWRMRVTTSGANAVLEAYQNGVLKGSFTDTTSVIASGNPGFFIYKR